MSKLKELTQAVDISTTGPDSLSIAWLDKTKHLAQFRIANKKLKKRVTGNIQSVGNLLEVNLHRSDYGIKYAKKKVKSVLEKTGISGKNISFFVSGSVVANSDPGPGDTIIAFSDIISGIFEGQIADLSVGDPYNALNDESISCAQQMLPEAFQVRVERIFPDTCDTSSSPAEFAELTILNVI